MSIETPSVQQNSILEKELDQLLERLNHTKAEMAKVIVGQQSVVDQVLVALLAGGHALLEGVPGLAKTLLVNTLADVLQLRFCRVQFTPDLMPSDLLGTEVLEADRETGERRFKFQPGPVFTQILLADEINRTPPKTQAALLEAMQERAISYARETRPLPKPFFVLATQNPIEQAGTYPLPEAQLDRFLLHIDVAYPSEQEELEILKRTTGGSPPTLTHCLNEAQVIQLQAFTREVNISDNLLQWVTRLIRATRPDKNQSESSKVCQQWLRWGAGPRAGQSLILSAKAHALLNGRLAVTRDDLQAMARPSLQHRLLLNFHAEAEQVSTADVIEKLLGEVGSP